MKTMQRPPVGGSALLYACLVSLFLLVSTYAQTSTGVLTGRVYNPRTGEYVRNADVRISQTTLTAITGSGGAFRIPNAPAGTVEVVVNYADYPEIRTTVEIQPGKNTTLELEFSTKPSLAAAEEQPLLLETFVVSSEIEGNAKALANQKNSMDLGRSLASDVFGDVTEGNVGEFLKYLPGIEMEYVEADTRGPRLGGMNPEYTGVSIDGMKSASADGFIQYGATENGTAGGGGRSFSFEQVSINSIESIEISRVTPANLDADAPAGTINLKTKRAFDRKGRLLKWSVATGFNSEEFTLSKTPGPDDHGLSRKFKPTVSFNYADQFMNNRLGVLFGYTDSNLYNEQQRAEHTYQRTPTAADPRPQVLTQIRFKDGPKWTNRSAYTGTIDFKATDDLMLSLTTVYNFYEATFFNRNVDFRASANSTSGSNGRQFAGGDGLTTFSTNSTASSTASNRLVGVSGGSVTKITNGYTYTPKFEWRRNNLLVEGALSRSYSNNTYESLRRNRAGFGQVNTLTGVQFEATRSGPLASDWTVVQTGGPDWTDLSNYKNPRMTDDVRQITNELSIARLDFTYDLDGRQPVKIRFGGKLRTEKTTGDRPGDLARWNYIGPGGGPTGSWAAYPSTFVHDPNALNVTYQSLNGGTAPPFVDTQAIGELFKSNPEYFVQSYSTAQYFNALYGNTRRFKEEVPAAYIMGDTRFGQLSLQAGVRWEQTKTTANEFDPLLPSEVEAGGFMVDGNGQANTPAGLDYQYTTKQKVDRKAKYNNLFPSVSLKYRFSENLVVDLGAGQTIRRPEVAKLTGVYTINEDAEIINASNKNLKPEYADRIAASLSYYFGGTNNLSITASDTKIANLFVNDEILAEDFGIDDPDLAGYLVRTTSNSDDAVRFRSLELAYRQRLSFLPGSLQSTSVFANYTRTTVSRRQPGVSPHTVSAGIDWRFKRLGLNLKGVWSDTAPWTSTVYRYRPAVTKFDGGLDFRITSSITAFMQVRNISNQDHIIIEASGDNVPVIWRRENYGANYVFGVRGTF